MNLDIHKYLFTFLFTVISLTLQAQQESTYLDGDKTFFGGPVIGINCSQIDGDTYSGFHSAGLNAGGMVFWRFMESVGMSVEFLYSQKGSHGVNETTDPYAGQYYSKYKIRLNYVEVPLVFYYFLAPRYQVGVGGSFNALLGSKESLVTTYPVHIDENLYPFNKNTFDLIGSISMMVWKGIMLSARYQYGITPLRNWENVPFYLPATGPHDQVNNMVTFRLAYLF